MNVAPRCGNFALEKFNFNKFYKLNIYFRRVTLVGVPAADAVDVFCLVALFCVCSDSISTGSLWSDDAEFFLDLKFLTVLIAAPLSKVATLLRVVRPVGWELLSSKHSGDDSTTASCLFLRVARLTGESATPAAAIVARVLRTAVELIGVFQQFIN